MLLEEIAPPAIAELCHVFARGDDVGEEHGRENAIGLGIPVHCGVPRTFEERLDFAEIRLGLSDRRDVPLVVQLDVRRAGDLIRNEPSRVAGNLGILAVLQNQRRHANRREDVADVDRHDPLHEREACARACAVPPVVHEGGSFFLGPIR